MSVCICAVWLYVDDARQSKQQLVDTAFSTYMASKYHLSDQNDCDISGPQPLSLRISTILYLPLAMPRTEPPRDNLAATDCSLVILLPALPQYARLISARYRDL